MDSLVKVWNNYKNLSIANLTALLITCQILDGILTYIGVSNLGTSREGNPMLRSLMEIFGPGQTLFVAKLTAILLLYLIRDLYEHSPKNVTFVAPLLHLVLVVYVVVALIPWAIVLFL